MIKNIMKNIGTRPPKMGSKEYNELYGISEEDAKVGAQVDKIYERQLKRIKELRAKGLTDEQIDNDNIIKQTKEDMKNVGKSPIDKKKFIEMVYDYGASGDKTLKGLDDNQKQAIASAWSTFQAEDEENETDEKFGSFYSDFLGK